MSKELLLVADAVANEKGVVRRNQLGEGSSNYSIRLEDPVLACSCKEGGASEPSQEWDG